MQFVKVCTVDEIPENTMRRFTIGDKEVLVARYENNLHALSEKCTHKGGPLSEGTSDQGVITCPLHFGQFDLKTGQVVGPPPFEPLQKYEVKVEDGTVYVAVA